MISAEYRNYLDSPKWQSIREQIIERDGHVCSLCGNKLNLQVHHISGKYRFHEEDAPETLITLCDGCHKQIHQYFDVCDTLRQQYESMRKGR